MVKPLATSLQDWEETLADVESIDWTGEKLRLEDVPAKRNPQTGAVLVNIDEVIRARMRLWLSQKRVDEPRDLLLLSMLYAKPGWFKRGEVSTKFMLNKMLFYQWKTLEREGVGESFEHDEFVSGRAGPIPVHLKEDLERLEARGLVDVEWSTVPGRSTHVKLTRRGRELSKNLWRTAPETLRTATQVAKQELFPLSPDTIKQWFHRKYPEYRRTYIEPDTE